MTEPVQINQESIRYFNRNLFRSLIFFILGILLLIGIYKVLPYFLETMFMVAMAIILTAIIGPLIDRLETRGIRRLYGVLLFFGLLIALLVFGAVRGIPVLLTEVGKISDGISSATSGSSMEEMLGSLNTWIAKYLPDRQISMETVTEYSSRFFGQIGSLLANAAKAGVNLLFIVIITFFFLVQGDRMMKRLIESVPNRYFEMALNISYKTQKQLTNFLRGQLLAATGVAIMSIIGLHILNWTFDANISGPFIIGSIAGFANMIPYIGPFIGMVPAILVSLFNNMGDPAAASQLYYALHIIVMFLIVQQIDNYVISPVVVSGSMEMHPLTVMLVVFIGSQFGVLGMFLAVPVWGIIKVLVLELYQGLKGHHFL